MVKKKVASVSYPLQQIKIIYANQTKGKSYTDEEDRFLLCELAKYGVGKEDTPDKIKADINSSPLWLFDWYLKSRTPQEIARRCTTLVSLIEKEEGGDDLKKKGAAANGGAAKGGKRKAPGGDDAASASSRASTPAVGAPAAKKARKSVA